VDVALEKGHKLLDQRGGGWPLAIEEFGSIHADASTNSLIPESREIL